MKKAIVLCGTRPHIDLIKNLKKRGYFTILVDFAEHPIAKEFCDLHIVEDAFNKDKVLEIALNNNVDLVISVAADQAYIVAAFVMEKLEKYSPVKSSLCELIADKTYMKKLMYDYKIPTAKYIVLDNLTHKAIKDMRYPLIVKPVDTYGSKGVRRADDYATLLEYFNLALKYSKKRNVVVEEFIEGIEIGMDCIVKNGVLNVITTRQRVKILNSEDKTQQIYGSIWPAKLPKDINEKIHETIQNLVDALSLSNSAIMIQLILTNTGDLSIIEFALRIGGGENFNVIKLGKNFDIIDTMIDMYLREDFNTDCEDYKNYLSDNIIYCKPSIFGELSFRNSKIPNNVISFTLHKKRGDRIIHDLTSSNRVGTFVLKDSRIEGLLSQILNLYTQFDVIDISGNSILLKEMYMRGVKIFEEGKIQ
ncbi:Phosphoribosylamine--glycine ligase [Candidatus Izimaplasma bacterium HR1]|uniref:ATP-grasp domain-containing protein n=1 Tax=Candidatus Izimoplasma sp. HR1 TaxID=1541959 RepID=UPI0004F90F8D|nr:Phosphoribosylamine--glycine ligase [Candidatus Izimaplasma bacterium HR1]